MKLKPIRDIFKRKEYVFETTLNVEECVKRLRSAISRESIHARLLESKEIIGTVTEEGFSYRLRGGKFQTSY